MRARDSAWWHAMAGGGIIAAGLILTLASLSNPNGGAYIFYGMMIMGGVWLVRGLGRVRAIDALPPIAVDEPSAEDD